MVARTKVFVSFIRSFKTSTQEVSTLSHNIPSYDWHRSSLAAAVKIQLELLAGRQASNNTQEDRQVGVCRQIYVDWYSDRYAKNNNNNGLFHLQLIS